MRLINSCPWTLVLPSLAYLDSFGRADDHPTLSSHIDLIDLAMLLSPFDELGLTRIVGGVAGIDVRMATEESGARGRWESS